MIYEKTDDPNIIKQIETYSNEIDIDKLEAEIKDLEQQIEDAPKPKTKPDQETLDYYNAEIEMRNNLMLEEQLIEKKELLIILKSVK